MTVARHQPRSLIETISAGYTVINQRLWVLVIPFALDIYLWFGTQLSFAPFFRLIRDLLVQSAAQSGIDPQRQEQLVTQLQQMDMRGALALLNFVPLLVPHLQLAGRLSGTEVEHVIYVDSPPGLIASIVVINLVALLISSLFLTVIAGKVRGEPVPAGRYMQRLVSAVVGIGSYALILLGIGIAFGLPFVLLVSAVTLIAPTLTPLIVMSGYMLLFWIYILTRFAVEAVLISDTNPLQAMSYSIQVVRYNFAATLGLFALSIFLIEGLGIVWLSLANNWIGLLLSLLGSSYVGSGLAAARLIFYRDRLIGALHKYNERKG